MQAEESTVVFALTQEGNALDDRAKLEVLVSEANERPALALRHEPTRGKASTRAALGFTILVFFAFMLGTLCIKLPNKARFAGGTRRRLADSKEENTSDDELDEILEACVDIDEELGRLQNFVEKHETNPLEASTQKTLLVALMRGVAASLQPSTSSSPERQSSRLGSVAGKILAPPPLQPSVAGASASASGSALFTREKENEMLSALKPDSWLDNIPDIGDEESGEIGTKAALLENQKDSDDGEQPCTSASAMAQLAPTAAFESLGWNVNLHPFVRLPNVPPAALEEASGSQISQDSLVRWNASSGMLRTMHDLFLQKELTARDVKLLAYIQDKLVRSTILRAPSPRVRLYQSNMLRQIGLSFLTLEAVVCACHLLGINMVDEDWWTPFTKVLRTNYDLPEPVYSAEGASPAYYVSALEDNCV
ncbi:hypothetical protein Esti_003254 [Eimeria stiedai]